MGDTAAISSTQPKAPWYTTQGFVDQHGWGGFCLFAALCIALFLGGMSAQPRSRSW